MNNHIKRSRLSMRVSGLLMVLLIAGLCLHDSQATAPSKASSPKYAERSMDEASEQYYKIYAVTDPAIAGDAWASLSEPQEGDEVWLYQNAKKGFKFINWTIDGIVASTAAEFAYTMPAHDVTIVANYVFDPESPGDPNPEEQKVSHPVVVRAMPSIAADMVPSDAFRMDENDSQLIYAYPKSGWKLTGWTINGEEQQSAESPLSITMRDKALDIVAHFTFDPSSPANPSPNYYNPNTGEVIVDDFTPGSLYQAIYNTIGYDSQENVSSIIVKGEITPNDLGLCSAYPNASIIDISRTGGVTSIPTRTFTSAAITSILLPSTITSICNYAFANCENLASLTVYALVPPECTQYTFSNFPNKDNCTVYVPASALALYTAADYWKDFTILPISTDAHVLQVNLPTDAADGRYKHNSIEVVNVNTGVRQKYVVSDRRLYTFNGLRKDERYNVYMFSQSGLEIGCIENVVIPDSDIEVTFLSLKPMHDVYANVTTPDGTDVTDNVTVEWLKPLADGSSTYLRKGARLGEVPEGQALLCQITLNEQLGSAYKAPAATQFTVSEGQSVCEVQLTPFRQIALSGTIIDGDGAAIYGASVAASQMLNGRCPKSYTAKSDRTGRWEMKVLDAPSTTLTYAMSDCINVNDTIAAFSGDISALDLGKVALKSIVGARITYSFNYLAAGDKETSVAYPDYQNVAITAYNVTQNRPHPAVSVQYPLLVVLDENINPGDELRLTASSKANAFIPVEQSAVIGDDQCAKVTFDIVGKGGISAAFEMTDNAAVTAMLYGSDGELFATSDYKEAKASFANLEDGEYELVSMGKSNLMGSILRLSNFDEIGLTVGKDYVKNVVTVKSGEIAAVNNAVIPAFDESAFLYTNAATSFTANKASVTAGNYITLRAAVDFKTVYKPDVSNVALIVDIPEDCDFIEQSVIQGPNLLPYTYDNNRLIVQLGNSYTTQVRFCVMPTKGGSVNASASISFDLNGKAVTQPIGAAVTDVKDLELTIPCKVKEPHFAAIGYAPAYSEIIIHDGDDIIGTGKSNALGAWNIACELTNPYNLSLHNIYAAITTKNGSHLVSKTQKMVYDINSIQVSKVTMYYQPEGGNSTQVSEFDFIYPKSTSTKWTIFGPKKFTYTIEFTDNDPERISNVILYVHLADGRYLPCNAAYDENKGFWYAECDLDKVQDTSYPVNCSVDFDYESEKLIDLKESKDAKEEITALTDNYTLVCDQVKAFLDSSEELDYDELYELTKSLGIPISIDEEGVEIEWPADFDNWSTAEQEAFIESQADKAIAEDNELLSSAAYNPTAFTYDGNPYFDIELDGIHFKTTDCAGVTAEQLIADGFKATSTTDGTTVYTKITATDVICVDIANNLYIVTNVITPQPDFAMLKTVDYKTAMEKYSECMDCIDKVLKLINFKWPEIENFAKLPEEKLDQLISKVESQLKKVQNWSKRCKSYTKQLKWTIEEKRLSNVLASAKIAKKICNKLVGRLLKALPFAGYIATLYDCYSKSTAINNLFQSIPNPCKDDEAHADACRAWCIDLWATIGIFATVDVIGSFSSDAAIISGVLSSFVTSGASLGATAVGAVSKAVLSIGSIVVDCAIDDSMNKLYNTILELDCMKNCGKLGNPDCPLPPGSKSGSIDEMYNRGDDWGRKRGGGRHRSGCSDDDVTLDPSGFVYEAVVANRVEGVQATIYYKETTSDMYGDPHENVVKWDAEEYAQKNPLFTDAYGMYQWDVPQGLWQVRFEKDGYVTACSEWLPVPPPQLDVNIAIAQRKQPEVTEARAYEEGVEVQFDKFMDISTLNTANIYVTANDEKLNGEIRLIDSSLAEAYASEDDPTALRYASRVRFVPELPLSATTGEVRVAVSRNVLSYAGIPMTENFSQALDVEKEVQAIAADDIKLLYGGEKQLTIFALPYDAAVGRTLRIANSCDMIASISAPEVTLDDDGKATITVKGDLPGKTILSFTIDDVTVTGECAVEVVTEIITAEAPKSSRASGTAVYRGTKIELSTDTKDGVIYYTTDGSCPCDAEGTRRKYTVPIVVTDDIRILAITSVDNDEDISETVEFNYTLKRSNIDVAMAEGWTWISHNLESPVAASAIAEDENVQRIKGKTQEVVRDPVFGMVGSLQSLNASECYKVNATAATSRLRLTDVAWNPATPIALSAGWNWLGYPVDQTMSVDEAFALTDAETLDVIVGQNGFAQYDGEKWLGTLQTLTPGAGYMYQSQSDKDAIYNTSIVSNAAATYAPSISDNSPLVVDVHKYPSIMPVIATLADVNGATIDNSHFQVNAFCGTECRGIGRLVDGLVMMNVYGNANDEIILQVVNAEGNLEFACDARLSLRDDVVGSVISPHVIAINSQSGISDTDYQGCVKVIVDGDMLRITGIATTDIDVVEVYDLNGQKLMRETCVSESGIRLSRFSAGVLLVIVHGGGSYTYHKVSIF